MKDYFKKTEYVLEHLYFDYLNIRYQGQGILTWNPEEGFHIEAFLEKPKTHLYKKIELHKVEIIRQKDICSIRMRPQGFDWAIAPKVHFDSRADVLFNHRLSINLDNVIFSESGGISSENSYWRGSAIYETKTKLNLSDVVHSEMHLNGQVIERNSQFSGIWYEDDFNQKIAGRMIDDKRLKLHWKLSKSLWSKPNSWRWSEAMQDAMSILFGETVWLLQREVRRGAQTCMEIRTRGKLDSLGLLSLFSQNNRLDKNVFIKLTEFFVRNGANATICRNIFNQMLEASRQQSWQATELLLSTILEATLRSIDQHPFSPRKDSWNVGKSLENFFQHYLASSFQNYLSKQQLEELRTQVMKAHTYLRDRNAHPDWLFSQGGALSEEETEKSLDNMIFLSRFYGYIILALAGFKALQPIFPKPHRDWGAMMVLQQLDENETENELSESLIPGEQTLELQKQLVQAKTYHEKTMILRRFSN